MNISNFYLNLVNIFSENCGQSIQNLNMRRKNMIDIPKEAEAKVRYWTSTN